MSPTLQRRVRGVQHRLMNGRRYFQERERSLDIEGLPPDEVQEKAQGDLQQGEPESRVGGRIAHRDLKRLSPEEIAVRRERSESFLTRPVKHFPAEEATTARDASSAATTRRRKKR